MVLKSNITIIITITIIIYKSQYRLKSHRAHPNVCLCGYLSIKEVFKCIHKAGLRCEVHLSTVCYPELEHIQTAMEDLLNVSRHVWTMSCVENKHDQYKPSARHFILCAFAYYYLESSTVKEYLAALMNLSIMNCSNCSGVQRKRKVYRNCWM